MMISHHQRASTGRQPTSDAVVHSYNTRIHRTMLVALTTTRRQLPAITKLPVPVVIASRFFRRGTSVALNNNNNNMSTTTTPAASSSTSSSSSFVPAVYSGFVDAVGNTPLIYLKGASERTQCSIYGKAEFLNPGGSVKDRAAKFLIEGLERDGKLKPGGTVVEGTAGNTGYEGLRKSVPAKPGSCQRARFALTAALLILFMCMILF